MLPLFFVINPKSSSGLSLWQKVQSYLADAKYDYRLTEKVGHAIEITESAINDGYKLIVSIGGDGTISEVVNGYMNSNGLDKQVYICTIHAGTGGDWCRTTNARNLKYTDIIDLLLTCDIPPFDVYDVGKVNCKGFSGLGVSRYFLNISSFGISALIANQVEKSIFKGPWSYWIQTFYQNIFNLDNYRIEYQIDDSKLQLANSYLFAIGNGKYFGGGMQICPNADPQDGKFTATLMQNVTRFQLLKLGGMIKSGNHLKLENVTEVDGKRIIAKSEHTIFVEADGEVIGSLPAEYEVIPNAIRIVRL